jgi:hypothetical protein
MTTIFAPVRIAKVVREALGEVAAVTGRDRRDVACPRLGQDRDDQVRRAENHSGKNEPEIVASGMSTRLRRRRERDLSSISSRHLPSPLRRVQRL